MLIIGLTGGLGAGKTAASQAFSRLGVPVIDADDISHALTAREGRALGPIRDAFGLGVFEPDGSLSRSKLRALVLQDVQAKQRLESILHPMIRREVERLIQDMAENPYVLLVIPLLVETGAYDDLLDRVLVIDCSEATQIRRALARGSWSEAEIRGMLAKQASREKRLDRADDVINNEGDESGLRQQVIAFNEKYRQLALRKL